jgi:hypothetical protein
MSVLNRIAEAFPGHRGSWIIEAGEPPPVPLTFYGHSVLVGIRNDESDPDSEEQYVVSENDVFHLDGSLDAVMRVNRADSLQLRREQVSPYLRFVFSHVGDGKLRIVEEGRDLPWTDEALGDALITNLIDQTNSLIHPIQVSTLANSHFEAVMTGLFRDLLVECKMEVAPDGALSPLGQRPLLEELPVRVHQDGHRESCG